jgi:endo-1,4-beta-D-glucanase Y
MKRAIMKRATLFALARGLLLGALALPACASQPQAGSDIPTPEMIPERRPAPFGSHSFAYPTGAILPAGTRGTLDAAVTAVYDRWKAAYLAQGCGGYYVRTSGGTGAKDAITVSEGHGYGMMIAALMAGHDPEAQTIFDGLVQVFRRFPSNINASLMSWAIGPDCKPVEGPDSATDGDLDVAFGLLLANRQWGSAGPINYFGEALKVMGAIKRSDLNPQTSLPLLGDWATSEQFYYSTRPSDFMPDHFRAFAASSGVAAFTTSVDRIYEVTARLQAVAGSSTGLLPDFAINTHQEIAPAPPEFLEGANDGDYSFNACRVPWRFGTDFIASGDARAKTVLAPINRWIKGKTAGDPQRIAEGYRLDGSPIGGGPNGAFVAPLAVAAMVDAGNQAWLDSLWRWMVDTRAEDYYGDSIRLLSMIVVSGNWWVP